MSDAAAVLVAALRLDRWPSEEVASRVDAGLDAGVGGFILFGGTERDAERACVRIHRDGDAVWIGSDLERGPGQQFTGAQTLPPSRALAEHPEAPEVVRRAGAFTGLRARELGLNWVLAPVLDLDVEARNPIVGTRSFGPDGDRVGELASAWIDGCQAAGVAACAKHFPGHGRTTTDSHLELPRVEATRDQLAADLTPFRRVCPFVASIMTSHVAYPALGDTAPATLSPGIVSGLLRGELGFEGLVATDAMIMAGATGARLPEVEAVRAGCDLIVYPADVERAASAIADEVQRDEGLANRVARAAERSRRAFDRFVASPTGAAGPTPSSPAGGGDAAGEERSERWIRVAGETLRAREVDVAGWSLGAPTDVHLVWDDPTGVPEVVDAGDASLPPREFGTALLRRLAASGWTVRDAREVYPGGAAPTDMSVQRIVAAASTPRGFKGHTGFSSGAECAIEASMQSASRSLLIVFGHERLLAGGRSGVCAWGVEPVMQEAAADWLTRRVAPGEGA